MISADPEFCWPRPKPEDLLGYALDQQISGYTNPADEIGRWITLLLDMSISMFRFRTKPAQLRVHKCVP